MAPGRLFEWVRWYVLGRAEDEVVDDNRNQYGLFRVELALGAIIDLLFVTVVGWFATGVIVAAIPPVISYRVAFALSWHLKLIVGIWIAWILASPVYLALALGRLRAMRGREARLEHLGWIFIRVLLTLTLLFFFLLIRPDPD